jgi:hypothetical protein
MKSRVRGFLWFNHPPRYWKTEQKGRRKAEPLFAARFEEKLRVQVFVDDKRFRR